MILNEAPFEYNFSVCSEDTQYTLHQDNKTKIQFTITIDGILCTVCLTFSPFRRHCNLTYHEYKLSCFVPQDACREAVSQSKHLIIVAAQQLYNKCFFANAGYKLAILQTELNILWHSDGNSVSVRNLLPNSKANHQKALIEEPPPKRQKARSAESDDAFVPWTLPVPTNITLHDIQKSYRSAIADGRLKYDQVPQPATRSDGSVQVKRWDPYVLTARAVPRGLLHREKLEDITQRVQLTTQFVPYAVNWIAKTQQSNLTSEDLKIILRQVFGHDEPFLIQQPDCIDEMPMILRIAANSLIRADDLKCRSIIFKRAEAVIRIVAYALTEVSIVSGEATDEQVGTWMSSLGGGKNWLIRGRNFARCWCWAVANLPHWRGRDLTLYLMLVERGELTLRSLFRPVFPAGVGELVSTLSSEEYWKDLPPLTTLPGIIEIVMMRLDGCGVKQEAICRALGCPDSYLEGFDSTLFLKNLTCSQAMTLYKQPKDKTRGRVDPIPGEFPPNDDFEMDDDSDIDLTVFEDLFSTTYSVPTPSQQQ